MKKIAIFVIGVHLLLIFFLGVFHVAEKSPAVKKLAIKQYAAKPAPKVVTAPPPKAAPAAASRVKPKAITPPGPIAPPPPPANKPAPKQTPEKKPTPQSPPPAPKAPTPTPASSKTKAKTQTPVQSPLTQKLMKELEESIAKIEGKHDKVDTSRQIATPRAIDTLKIDHLEKDNSDEDYTDTLILCLRQSLNLPDFGEVKIKLTLRQDGTVDKLIVLKTESENNRRYLETHLPNLKFPALNKQQHTFVLTFCNEV